MKPILLVEDTEDDVVFMKRALKKAEINLPLHVAMDGQEAIDYLEGKGAYQDRTQYPFPCLVLLDLKLPKRNGLEVLKWIRHDRKLHALPVIILTSSREDTDVQQAYSLGANSYKVKPSDAFELADFATAVRRYWICHDQSCTTCT